MAEGPATVAGSAGSAPSRPPQGEVVLALRGVHTGYGHMEVLHGVDLEVRRGEIVTLIGCNGAGKTTTLATISGLCRCWQGDVVHEGVSVAGRRPDEIVARGVCHVPEGRQIFRDLTVLENLRMGAFLRRDAAGVRRDLDHCCELFPVLAHRREQLGGTLSGGEQQMLAIARALMARPRVLLLDEPSLGIAPLLTAAIFDKIRAINAEGVTVLLVEQNANLALRTAHRAYVLETGRVTLSGPASELAGNPEVQRAYLGL